MYDPALIAEVRADLARIRHRLLDALGAGARENVACAYLYEDLDRKTSGLVAQLGVMAGEPRQPSVIEGARS